MPLRTHPTPPVPPAALNDPASDTMWTNLGDWSSAQRYGDAAEALALRVGNAAGLQSHDVVVDYACGYGDSLRLWIERFGVRRAVGVEPDPRICELLRTRIAAWGLGGRITVVASRAELLPPRAADREATAAICVDAAYHFTTRVAWWTMLAESFASGGRIAAADLLLADGYRAGIALRCVARAMRIPTENLMDAPTLRRALASLGLEALHIDSCGTEVLDGFAANAPARHLGLRITRGVIRRLRSAGAVDYAILGAKCQSGASSST